jgi:energy-coupling factor transport system permease protein
MLDPRSKLLISLAYAALIALTRKPAWLAGQWTALVVLIAVMGQLKPYLRWSLLVLPMAAFFGAVTWWSVGRSTGISAAMALAAISTVFFVFFISTEPEDLGNSLVQTGLPFPVAFVVTAAMQFVPLVGRNARAVIEAQQARGIVLKPGRQALKNYPALLIPLLIQCFRMADSLAEAMEARGFNRAGRTFRKRYRMRSLDWLSVVCVWGAIAVVLYFWAR